jgi:predicted transposase YbfD/YdcC
MDVPVPLRLATHFAPLHEPRVRGRCDHRLLDIVILALCGVIANCNDWQQIALFARERRDWFARFLPLSNGIPSHDTFERVFDRIDPACFQACFRSWVRAIAAALDIPHIAIDGKTLRGSGRRDLDRSPLHLVSAWATDARLSLGQVAVAAKSNEITAIPKLLELLDLKGAFVSIDAMGCQTKIAEQIVTSGGEYLLAVKGNQEGLLTDVQECVQEALDVTEPGRCEVVETTDTSHGREERRTVVVVPTPKGIPGREAWKKLSAVGMCVGERSVNGTTVAETRYYILSRVVSAKTFVGLTRNHWSIENHQHWQLDVTFDEDSNRVSSRHGAENLALLRRLALTLLKRDSSKLSLKCKRIRAAINTNYLETVLRTDDNLGKV